MVIKKLDKLDRSCAPGTGSQFQRYMNRMSIHGKITLSLNLMYGRRTGSLFKARMQSSSSARMNKSNFRLLTKLCSVHMTVYKIVVHRNVDNWIRIIGMMYFDADNSSMDSGRILAIHSYTQLHEQLQLKQ